MTVRRLGPSRLNGFGPGVLVAFACAASPSEPLAIERPSIPPFSAAQIRDATAEGRTYEWRVSDPEGSRIRRIVFRNVSTSGADLERAELSLDGEPLRPSTRATVSWTKLESHAHFPIERTTLASTGVRVPAGEFDAWLYTVREIKEGADTVTRTYFARALPGAPVKMLVTQDGETVLRMELIRHVAGAP